jgi:hypothetical protein
MKILHNKVELDDMGCCTLEDDSICQIHDMIKTIVGDEYTVITSPMDINLIDSDDVIIRIDCKEYTYNELIKIIKSNNQTEFGNKNEWGSWKISNKDPNLLLREFEYFENKIKNCK